MRKKTALRTPQQRETSVRKPGGLIDRGENAQDSATAKSALTNRSHRTHSIRSHRILRPDPPCKIIPEARSGVEAAQVPAAVEHVGVDRKSTRLNSSHGYISYAVFCLK